MALLSLDLSFFIPLYLIVSDLAQYIKSFLDHKVLFRYLLPIATAIKPQEHREYPVFTVVNFLPFLRKEVTIV